VPLIGGSKVGDYDVIQPPLPPALCDLWIPWHSPKAITEEPVSYPSMFDRGLKRCLIELLHSTDRLASHICD
jgi:hypothetical protein